MYVELKMFVELKIFVALERLRENCYEGGGYRVLFTAVL
jgi:hypothetical protein